GVGLAALAVEEPFLTRMAAAGVGVNLVLGVLNLFPLPPLDGGRILAALLPPKQSIALSRIEPYGFIIVLVLVATGVLTNFWLRPLVNAAAGILSAILSPLASLF
ncbi:MAG TPA: site-2 protease family protein, partial [Burkholderia sp.]|nr:site-2 protease family protein [Burkholderia sp.]